MIIKALDNFLNTSLSTHFYFHFDCYTERHCISLYFNGEDVESFYLVDDNFFENVDFGFDVLDLSSIIIGSAFVIGEQFVNLTKQLEVERDVMIRESH